MTGNSKIQRDWLGNGKSNFTSIGACGHSDLARVRHDYYATDPVTIDALFSKESFADRIWEPACDEGHLSKMMHWKYGKQVRESDIVNRMDNDVLDFLSLGDDYSWDGDIITNPPYKYAKEFTEKALGVVNDGSKVAMFLKLQFLEGLSRREMFDKMPPKVVYVFSKRQNCARNGDFEQYKVNSAVCYAWFVWVKGFKGEPVTRWI